MGVGGLLHARTTVLTSKYHMQYYYVMCQRGSLQHRCYVQLDPVCADVLHDSLECRYDLVQVCEVDECEVDDQLLTATAP